MSVGKISSTQEIREDRRTPQELLSDDAGPSWQSRCINTLLRLLPIKKRLASAEVVQEHVRRLALRPASHEPTGLGRGVEVTEVVLHRACQEEVCGSRAPRWLASSSPCRILPTHSSRDSWSVRT